MKEDKQPKCHFKPMSYAVADDGAEQVAFWECLVCGHTKEDSRWLAG